MESLTRTLWLAALMVSLAPRLAVAAPVVLSGTTGSGPAPNTADAAAIAQVVLDHGDFQMGGFLSDALALTSAPVWVLGASQQNCSSDPVSTAAFDQFVTQASEAVTSLDFGIARSHLQTARASLPCLDDVVNSEALYDVWFLEGLSAFHEGNQEEAKAAFGVATALDPKRQWSDDYAPAPQGVFLAALQEALAREGRALGRDSSVVGEVIVDGVPFSGTETLLAGTHLVQVRTADGISGVLLDLPPGDGWLAMLSPEGVEQRMLRGDPNTATFLGEALTATGWAEVLLVSEVGSTFFDVESRMFSRSSVTPNATVPSSARFSSSSGAGRAKRSGSVPGSGIIGGAILAGVGAGVAVGGFALSGSAWTQGTSILEDGGDLFDYTNAYRRNTAGFGIGMAGAVAAGTGAIAAIVSAATRGKGASVQAQRVRAQMQRHPVTLEAP